MVAVTGCSRYTMSKLISWFIAFDLVEVTGTMAHHVKPSIIATIEFIFAILNDLRRLRRTRTA
jgi:hypothetical protein